MLKITAIGEQRFRLIASERQDDGLNIGDVEMLDNEPTTPLPDEYQEMAAILAGVLDDLGRLYESLDRHFDDASWVTSRFVEILPIDLEEKQRCLEQSDPVERLRIVRKLLDSTRSPSFWRATTETSRLPNVRYAPKSGRSANIGRKVR